MERRANLLSQFGAILFSGVRENESGGVYW